MMKFYNRESELALLSKYDSASKKQSVMTVLFGRRRIGKTELIRIFIDSLKSESLYFFISRKKRLPLLDEFSDIVRVHFPNFYGRFRSFDEFFNFLFDQSRKKHLTVVFDEFQNILFSDAAAISILQKEWDAQYRNSRVHLILVGSSVSMMERIFTDSKEPLFGRATAKIHVQPFSAMTINQILHDHSLSNPRLLVTMYTLFGGVPKYFALMDQLNLFRSKIVDVLNEMFITYNAPLREEAYSILIEEFGKNYQTYFSILLALALGHTSPSDIASKSGVEINSIQKYLDELANIYGIIKRKEPLIPYTKAVTRKTSHYYISDELLKFWFRYIYRFQSRLEIDEPKNIAEDIIHDLTNIEGLVFESIVKDMLVELNKKKKFISHFDSIGSWWTRTGNEIDIVAFNLKQKEILFGECKLSDSHVNDAAAKKLQVRSEQFPLEWKTKHYAFFVCTKKTSRTIKGVSIFSLKDLIKQLS